MRNKGFTLVELLGVIIIIALLSLVIFPNIISSFFEASNKLDDSTKILVIEAAKDYYHNNRDNISKLDYCVTISELQNEGLLSYDIKDSEGKLLLSDALVKISKNGSKYEYGVKCDISNNDIINAAKDYYNDKNIIINDGESKCISIATLQNAYYLSKNISNNGALYDSNINLKLTNNGELLVEYNVSC